MRRSLDLAFVPPLVLVLAALATLAGCQTGSPYGATPDAAPPSPDLATAAAPDLAEPPAPSDRLDVRLTTFQLEPGEEKILCEYVPPDGKEHWINRFTVDISPGSHHLVVFRINDPQGRPHEGPFPCSQLDIPDGFDGLLPGTQNQHTDFTFPAGVAMKVRPTHGLLFQSHYINATQQRITAEMRWQAMGVPKEKVTTQAGMLFYSNYGLVVPPMQVSSSSLTCKLPTDMHLFTALGHMHKHGLTFDADINGQPIYHTDTWDEPETRMFPAPGIEAKAGDRITWTCKYDNDTAQTLRFGNSAVTNEMCIFVGLFYPSPDSETDFFCRK